MASYFRHKYCMEYFFEFANVDNVVRGITVFFPTSNNSYDDLHCR